MMQQKQWSMVNGDQLRKQINTLTPSFIGLLTGDDAENAELLIFLSDKIFQVAKVKHRKV